MDEGKDRVFDYDVVRETTLDEHGEGDAWVWGGKNLENNTKYFVVASN